ncbi:MAG: hypothetical protein R2789_05770 [Microthrixaceae bacterium]
MTNRAVARALARGHDVVGTDDGGSAGGAGRGTRLRVLRTARRPDPGRRVGRSGAYVATPGLADSHPVFELARSCRSSG